MWPQKTARICCLYSINIVTVGKRRSIASPTHTANQGVFLCLLSWILRAFPGEYTVQAPHRCIDWPLMISTSRSPSPEEGQMCHLCDPPQRFTRLATHKAHSHPGEANQYVLLLPPHSSINSKIIRVDKATRQGVVGYVCSCPGSGCSRSYSSRASIKVS